MISPELLRRYPFFATLSDAQLKRVANQCEEVEFAENDNIFTECDPANALYLLISGGVEFIYKSEEEYHPTTTKEFNVGEVNPGEVFGLSALLEPYSLNTTARCTLNSRLICVDAAGLRGLFAQDSALGMHIMTQALRSAMERMAGLRAQLAAAWS